MQSAFRFSWRCSYRRSIFFDVIPANGARFEVELLTAYDPSDAATYNGGPGAYDREVKPRVGFLRLPHDSAYGADLASALNAWRRESHAAQLKTMRAAPDRYGDVDALTGPGQLLAPPEPALGVAKWSPDGWRLDRVNDLETVAA